MKVIEKQYPTGKHAMCGDIIITNKDEYLLIGWDYHSQKAITIDVKQPTNNVRIYDDIEEIRNYEVDDNDFTLITKDELGQYISDLYGLLDEKELELYNEDIILLKNLYNTFDWDNDTLVFSYSY